MALMCSVMAFATVLPAGSLSELQAALTAAANGDEIQLTADINYGQLNQGAVINITKSITLNGKDNDGNIHTITGASHRGDNAGQYATVWVNKGGSSDVDVVFKDIRIINTKIRSNQADWAICTRGHIHSLTLQNAYLEAQSIPLQIGGNHTGLAYTPELVIEDSHLKAVKYYALLSWNKFNLTATNSTFEGWAGLYFKGVNSSIGCQGSVVSATGCNFECFNIYSGRTNAFGVFVCEDDGITITATNCRINSSAHGDQAQAVLLASGYYMGNDRRTQPISLTLAGDNTRIIMDGYYYSDIDVKAVETFNNNTWYASKDNYGGALASDDYIVPFSVTMTGGTYDVNPMYYRHVTAVNRDGDGNPIMDGDKYSVVAQSPIIPAGYAIVTVKDGDKTLYRVTKSDVSYDINGQYETSEAGENPTTSFIVETTDDQPIELVNNETEAAYVQVRDNGDGDATVLLVGKVENAGTPSEAKVDQTLIVNNGLDVQGESQVVVQSGSTLQIGEGGIVTEKPENIVIEADENGAASLLMDPAITVNQTPNLTVEMKVSQAGKDAYGDYWWHRFAMPVGELANAWTKSPNYGTYLYGWNYATNNWEQVAGGSTNMQPWKGYTLTYNEAYDENEVVTYTFKGNLVGNQDADLTFEEEGYQFFGNSYTGYMDVLTLINQLTNGNIDKSVWMWNPGNQTYTAVPLEKLADPVKAARLKSWQKEVAPMQTFIMRLRGASSANETVSYADAIWGNPRYGNNSGSNPAPRRRVASADEAYMEIVVTAANGQSDRVDFTVNSSYSDAFENGVDASKFMNERYINLYATVSGEDYTSVATDNIEGKTISLQTKNDITYTISFENVETEAYALLDKLTNTMVVIEEGNTYEFAAQPNSTVEGRFEIVSRAQMPTAIENTEVNANVKGIYTITGQYLGENFDILPAGVYVVNGVKIVK